MQLTREQCWQRLHKADHAVLCTTNATGGIDAVPVCFAVAGAVLASPVDRVKPKDSLQLARLKNLERDATATLLCERWDRDDWSKLWWVRADLVRRIPRDVPPTLLEQCEAALRERYVQYRVTEFADVIVFDVTAVRGWSASPDPVSPDPVSPDPPSGDPQPDEADPVI